MTLACAATAAEWNPSMFGTSRLAWIGAAHSHLGLRALGAAALLVAAGCGGSSPSATERLGHTSQALAPAGTFPIIIDATALSETSLDIGYPYDSTIADITAAREYDLAPNTYNLSANGTPSSINYTVTPTGTIDYDASLEGILTASR
jgi:hypothetical protein